MKRTYETHGNLHFYAPCSLYFFLQRAINEAATDWGLKCLRYEISMSFFLNYGEGHQLFYFSCFKNNDAEDISPPNGVKVAMEMQVEAERKKRAQILESEGKKRAQILESEGAQSFSSLE